MLNSTQVISKSFQQLSKSELYSILKLRVQVFCVEQNCPYQDIDGQDENAEHVYLENNNEIIAYARILQKNTLFHIGRVVVDENYRKHRLATTIMKKCIEIIKEQGAKKVEISAQSYLHDFYQGLGFENTGKYYLEDDIPHQQMVLLLN